VTPDSRSASLGERVRPNGPRLSEWNAGVDDRYGTPNDVNRVGARELHQVGFIPILASFHVGRRERAVDEHRFARTNLPEQVERGERFAMNRLGDAAPSTPACDIVRERTVLDLLVTEQS
jgi:hypothetical protein